MEVIDKELDSLNNTMNNFIKDKSKITKFKELLKDINLKLWDIESGKRLAEKNDKMLDINPFDLVRKGEKLYKELGVSEHENNTDMLLKIMTQNPILIERPIVIANNKAKIPTIFTPVAIPKNITDLLYFLSFK